MKQFLQIISLLLISIIFTNTVSAATYNNKTNKLTKEIFITTNQVNNDFGENYSKALDNYFTGIRHHKDIKSLENLNKVLEPIIEKYNKKQTLSNKERKSFNLIKNIYLRNQLTLTFIQ